MVDLKVQFQNYSLNKPKHHSAPGRGRDAGGSDREIAFKVLTDIQGNNYVSGIFKGNAKFGKKTLKSKGGVDIFLTKIDSKGKFLWAESFGTKADEAGSHLFLRNNGTCYLFSGFMGEDRGSDENQLPMKGKNLMIVDRGGKVIGSKEIKDAAYITMMNFAEEKIGELYVLTIPSKSKNWKLIKYVNFQESQLPSTFGVAQFINYLRNCNLNLPATFSKN